MRGGSKGVLAAVSAAGFALMTGIFAAAGEERPAQASACGGAIIARGAVARVLDGRSFALADGREIRLAGIEVAPLPPPDRADPASGGGEAARQRLAAWLAGAEIALRQMEAQPADRYGRLVGYGFRIDPNGETLLQSDLLAAGFARVAARAGDRACAAELLSRERAARRAKLGLWAGPYYESLDAEHPADVLAQRGRFALVEGKVVSVRESGPILYVNFGRHWATDFTVTILKRNERNFLAAGVEPRKLAGRRVLVRGWIEERGGPWIEASRPEQIELADGE
jgi:endonuclease YncB( thermonuclease family)